MQKKRLSGGQSRPPLGNLSNTLKALEAAALCNGTVQDVQVNQRCLIDKMLARYSTEFGVLRELFQNADDAAASTITVHLQCTASRFSAMHISNNGRPFTEVDWRRMTKIAEGNPDENTIGMFGVGFYSVFSIAEQPLIHSGSDTLLFAWKGDQLVTYRAKADYSADTTVHLNFRELQQFDVQRMCRFAIRALAFTRTVSSIHIICDGVTVMDAQKSLVEQQHSIIPNVDPHISLTATSPQKFFTCTELWTRPMKLTVSTAEGITHHEYLLVHAQLGVQLNGEYREKTHRILKKDLPQTLALRLLYDSAIHSSASVADNPGNGLHAALLSPCLGGGRVFVGLSTHQTTGAHFHLSTQLIPTIERENIDFQDQWLAVWNRELLSVAGLTARLIYDDQMQSLQRASPDTRSSVALHMVEAHAWACSAPSSEVKELLSDAFVTGMAASAEKPPKKKRRMIAQWPISLLVPTSLGIRTIENTFFLSHHSLEDLLTSRLAIIPVNYTQKAKGFFDLLLSRGLLQMVTREDLARSLKPPNGPLTISEFLQLVQFVRSDKEITGGAADRKQLLREASLHCPITSSTLHMRSLAIYLPPGDTSIHLPVPPNCLPPLAAKALAEVDLQRLLGLRKGSPAAWLTWLSHKTQEPLLEDCRYAEAILHYLSTITLTSPDLKGLHGLLTILKTKRCIPTSAGMQYPFNAALANPLAGSADIGEMPVVTLKVVNEDVDGGPKNGDEPMDEDVMMDDVDDVIRVAVDPLDKLPISRKFLKSLGVQNAVGVGDIRSRIQTSDQPEDIVARFLPYMEVLDPQDWDQLRAIPFLVTEASGMKRRASELYFSSNSVSCPEVRAPLEPLLTSDILHWPHLLLGSPVWTFLQKTGVKELPTMNDLLHLVASYQGQQRRLVLQYISENFDDIPPVDVKKVCFLEGVDGALYSPRECFLQSAPLFSCLTPELSALLKEFDLVDRLQIQEQPDIELWLQKVFSQPPSLRDAPLIMRYLTQRSDEVKTKQWRAMATQKFLPLSDETWACPQEVFIFKEDLFHQYGQLLEYVDYGEECHEVLVHAGVLRQPDLPQLTTCLLSNYDRYCNAEDYDVDHYLNVLREVARGYGSLPPPLQKRLKKTPLLPAYRLVPQGHRDGSVPSSSSSSSSSAAVAGVNKEDAIAKLLQRTVEWELMKAEDCYLIDNTVLQRLLPVPSAPDDLVLRQLYGELGAEWLSKCVQQDLMVQGNPFITQRSAELAAILQQRHPLLIFTTKGEKRANLKPSADLSNIQVADVPAIQQVVVFEGKSYHFSDTQTTCKLETVDGRPTLLLSAKCETDYFDIAQQLCEHFMTSHDERDAIEIQFLLATPLPALQRKGFPVEALLQLEQRRPAPPSIQRRALHSRHTRNNPFPEPEICPPPPPPPPHIATAPPPPHIATAPPPPHIATAPPPPSRASAPPPPPSHTAPPVMQQTSNLRNEQVHRRLEMGTTVTDFRTTERQMDRDLKATLRGAQPCYDKQVREEATRKETHHVECEVIPASHLEDAGCFNGMSLYVEKGLAVSHEFHTSALQFSQLLTQLTTMFGLGSGTVNMYADRSGSRIAFNRDRSLFFNLRYFHQCHFGKAPETALYFWFTTFCHELAHNHERGHNALHESILEGLVTKFIPKLLPLAADNASHHEGPSAAVIDVDSVDE